MTPQYAICRLRGDAHGSQAVVVLQHTHIGDVATRVVAPLVPLTKMKRVTRLHPLIQHGGQTMLIATELTAAIPVHLLGPQEGSAMHLQDDIKAALDLLFLGF